MWVVLCSRLDHITAEVIGQCGTTKFGCYHLLNPEVSMKDAGVLVALVHLACDFCGEDLTFLQFGSCLPKTGLITCRAMSPVWGSKICVD